MRPVSVEVQNSGSSTRKPAPFCSSSWHRTSHPSASRETRSSVGRLRDLCFGDDLTDFFIAEWRAEDVHADVGGDSPQLGYVSGKKAPTLDILEEAFETAGGERRREADILGNPAAAS
jgi:hypothetical protein